MIDLEAKGLKKYTIDTCVLIKMCENPNFGDLLSCNIDFKNSIVFLNSQTISEAEKYGHSSDRVRRVVRNSLGAKVVFEDANAKLRSRAHDLQMLCPMLHHGDSLILAFAESNLSRLISCDRDFLAAAEISKVEHVNPDLLACDAIAAKKVENKYEKKVRRETHRLQKRRGKKAVGASSLTAHAPRTPMKIVWSMFE